MKNEFIKLLLEEFDIRKKRNPSYSLRAFARDLNIGLGSLSETLNGKRNLSKSNFDKALIKMTLNEEHKELLRKSLQKKINDNISEKAELIDENTFKLISEWHYLAILNLAKLKNNSSRPTWIAKRLAIDPDQALQAIKLLKKLGLLDIKDGKLIRTSKPITTSNDVPSMAIKKHHLGKLKLAEKALFDEPIGRRDFGSITMPTNPEKLQKAKEMLTKTRIKIGELLAQGETSEIYTLSFQLFPLTKDSVNKDNHSYE